MNVLTLNVLTLLAFSLWGSLSPQEAHTLFEEAGQAFAAQNHAEAKEAYQKLVDSGFVSAELHYNLGTACLELNELGCALWNLEKASQLSPNAKDILSNLAWARSKQVDSVPSVQTPVFYRLLRNASPTLLAWALLGAAWALLLSFAGLRFFPLHRRLFRVVDGALWGVLALCASVYVAKWQAPAYWEEAIVLPESAAARQLPSAQATQLFVLHGGLKVQILERAGQFAKIRTANGQEAWLSLEALGML